MADIWKWFGKVYEYLEDWYDNDYLMYGVWVLGMCVVGVIIWMIVSAFGK